MLLHNNSNKIIGITVDTSILPGETGECPKEYEDNPVIKKYIDNKIFTVVGGEDSATDTQDTGDTGNEVSTYMTKLCQI